MQQLYQLAPTAIVQIDPIRDLIKNMNQAAYQLFAIAPDQLKSQRASELFTDKAELFNFTQQVLYLGYGWCENLAINIDEQIVPLEIKANKVDGDLLLCCENSLVSFEQRYKANLDYQFRSGLFHWQKNETVFEEIERQNQLLLGAVGDGIYGVDNQGCTTFVNAAAEQIVGWRKDDLIGKKIHDIMHHTHLDGNHYHVHDCPIYAAFSDGKIHTVDDEVFWSKSGEPVPVEYTSTPLTEHGELIGAVVIFRDITERKRTQEKLLKALAQVDQLKQRLEQENAYLQEEINADFNHHQIIGQSHQVQHMINQIELVAATNANVLIIGESGTGKELIARAIHEESERKARPLIRVNCAAIPAELFESEFFGHVKGAFSGAVSNRIGRFELADGGTIFLDEVGEIPLNLQGKLLRVLQEQQFERVGESTTRRVDVRVIAATNKDLAQRIKANKFREDLYFRLNVFPIQSPPLRERLDDLPLLVQHFINKVCTRINQVKPQVSLAQMQHLNQYHWPGNIRELENIIERQIILAKDHKLSFSFLSQELQYQSDTALTSQQVATTRTELLTNKQQKQQDKHNIEAALQRCRGKIYGANGAAELLGMKPTTLASRMKKHGISRQDYSQK